MRDDQPGWMKRQRTERGEESIREGRRKKRKFPTTDQASLVWTPQERVNSRSLTSRKGQGLRRHNFPSGSQEDVVPRQKAPRPRTDDGRSRRGCAGPWTQERTWRPPQRTPKTVPAPARWTNEPNTPTAAPKEKDRRKVEDMSERKKGT